VAATDGLDRAQEQEPPHDLRGEQRFAAAAGRILHHVMLRRLGAQGQRRQYIRAEVDGEDLYRGQRDEREADQGRGEDRGELTDVVAEQVHQELADVAVHRPAQLDGRDDAGKRVVQQYHHGGLPGHVGAAGAHRHADVGPFERRRVVGAVAGDRDHLAELLQAGHDAHLVLRAHPAEQQLVGGPQELVQRLVGHLGQLYRHDDRRFGSAYDADPAGDRLRGQGMVAGDHDHPDSGPAARGHGGGHLGAGWIDHPDETSQDQRGLGLRLVGAGPLDHPVRDGEDA
jgi:hypothetical protein